MLLENSANMAPFTLLPSTTDLLSKRNNKPNLNDWMEKNKKKAENAQR